MNRARRSRRFALASLLAAVTLALGLASLAQEGEPTESDSFTFGGPLVSVDVAKRTITVGGATGGTFEVDPNATLLSGSKKLTLAELETGWDVEGSGDLRGVPTPKKVITYLEAVDSAD
jgi:hypothetical protein